jgi:hypothetical protein
MPETDAFISHMSGDFLVQSHWVEVFERAAEFFERRMPRPRP